MGDYIGETAGKLVKAKKQNPIDTASAQLVWKLPSSTVNAANAASNIYKLKHGMFAGVPIICRAEDCPYADVCVIEVSDRVKGFRCPMEAGAIMARFEAWCRHFQIDLSGSVIKDEDLVDVSLIRDLVDNEIQTLRAENRIALNADFIGKTLVEVDKKCNAYYEDAVTPEASYKLQLQDKKYKILNLLNSTRQDKARKDKNIGPSDKALGILKKVADLLPVKDLDEVDFEDYEINDDEVESAVPEQEESEYLVEEDIDLEEIGLDEINLDDEEEF